MPIEGKRKILLVFNPCRKYGVFACPRKKTNFWILFFVSLDCCEFIIFALLFF